MANLATDFTFTNGSDLAYDFNEGISNNSSVNTLNGNDTILGIGEYTGINLQGEISTDKGNDLIVGRGEGNGIYLENSSTNLCTGDGSDLIKAHAGDVGYGIFSYGTIDTGRGNDRIISEAGRAGIINYNTILTGSGNDLIRGSGIFGINHTGAIDTGKGEDIIIGKGENDGFGISIYDGGTINTETGEDIVIGTGGVGIEISSDSTIDTGRGNDLVVGKGRDPFTGFNMGGSIELGRGDDSIGGFGWVKVDGDRGFDTANFDFNSFDLNGVVELESVENTVELIYDNTVMTLAKMELFVFADKTFSVDELIAESSDFV